MLICPSVYRLGNIFINPLNYMAVTRQQKELILADLIEKFKTSKSVMFSKNTGLSVQETQDLRGTLRDNGVSLHVAKKTLIRMAAKEAGYTEIPDEALEGPIAVAFSFEDEIAAASIIYKVSKANDKLTLTGGILDGDVFGPEKAVQLASIPSREELLAKLVGSMKAPISGFHGVLHGVMRQFVGTLQAVVDQGGISSASEAPAEPAKEEAKAETPAPEETTDEKVEAPAETPAPEAEPAKANEAEAETKEA